MQDDKKVPVHVRFPTPKDREAEDYLYALRKFHVSPTAIERICDGCHCQLHTRQNGLDFKCANCGIAFDLCMKCQKSYDLSTCPRGWGCNTEICKSCNSYLAYSVKINRICESCGLEINICIDCQANIESSICPKGTGCQKSSVYIGSK